MSEARLHSDLLVNALVRQVGAAGGIATVLAKGDADAGALLILGAHRGPAAQAWELGRDAQGRAALVATGPVDDPAALDQYVARRRARDRDLWVIELDVADAKRFAVRILLGD